jgi:hypothetical protein
VNRPLTLKRRVFGVGLRPLTLKRRLSAVGEQAAYLEEEAFWSWI